MKKEYFVPAFEIDCFLISDAVFTASNDFDFTDGTNGGDYDETGLPGLG